MTRVAEIAGAGFAGLAAGAALAQAGWRVRVHETADEPRSTGAGIYVHPFAQDVLREINACDRVGATAFAPTSRAIHIDGRQRSITPIDGQVLTTTRAALHAAVLATARAAGGVVATRSHAAAVDPAGALLLEDGTRLPADLVVAADGVRATLARQAGFTLDRHRRRWRAALAGRPARPRLRRAALRAQPGLPRAHHPAPKCLSAPYPVRHGRGTSHSAVVIARSGGRRERGVRHRLS